MLAPSTPKRCSTPIAARQSTMWSTTRCCLAIRSPVPRTLTVTRPPAGGSSPEGRDSQISLQQNISGVGGNHLHSGDLVDRHRRASTGQRGDTGLRHPGGQLDMITVAANRDHRQLVTGVVV